MAYTTIDKPSSYFNTVLYTGTGSTQSITGVGFQPDWVWIKQRSAIRSHVLYDVVRGATKDLRSNDTTAEATDAATLSSFNADGFTVVTDDKVNVSSGTYVSWNWLASNTSGSSNTSGTITSTVSANTTAGFSIVSYTGNGTTDATVGHGLGVTPKMIITKNRNNTTATNWTVYHVSLSSNNQITLNSTDAQNLPSPLMITTVGSSTYTLGSSRREINQSSDTYIAYCFAEVKGYSKFGSYTGNGNADGTFVYTGFKPAWIMVKESSNVNSWRILDNKRSPINVMNNSLLANSSSAEGSADHETDFVSNGFKIRSSDTNMNRSSGTFIYMAFAENPFVTSTGLPTTAR